jgi:hypothetical protein
MKFCYECGRTTMGDPRYCNFCGRSYDLKSCPRFHANPRSAEACAQCGSRELSRPQPKISTGWRLLEWFTRAVAGIALAILTGILGFGVLAELLKGQLGMRNLLLSVSFLTLLWSFWTYLPHCFRRLVRKSLLRKRRRSMDYSD